MERIVKILLLEDNPYDAELVRHQILKNAINHQCKHVSEYNDFSKAIDEYVPDIILSDYNLVGFTGMDALELVKQKCPLTPFIIVTGTIDEETAAETIKKGASDYVVKERLSRLSSAMKNALELKVEKEKRAIDREKLRISEERYKLAIEGSQDGIWDWDLKTNQIYFSLRWKSMLGYEDHDIENNYISWETLLHPDDKESTLATLERHLKKETPYYQIEFRLKCKDGSYKWIFTQGKAIYDQNSKPYRIAGSHTDISERKLMENKLIKAKEKAEESDRLKSAFLANISHEIRTPMNGICGFLNLLNEPQLSEDKKANYISIVDKCSTQLLSIIDDLVDISIIEAGQITISSTKVSVNTLLLENISIYQSYADKKNIELNLTEKLSDQEDLILTDQTKLQQVINNLINNAIKCTQKGHINLGVQVKDNDIEFYVEDTGIGVKPEFQEKIFDRFFQEERGETQFKEGTGLGLSISKAFIEAMGGKLWLKSEQNKGATFYFTLPYKPVNKLLQTERMNKEQILSWEGKTILIAEDDLSSFVFLRELLKRFGFKILHAKNGKEAVAYCEKIPSISLVLMDLKMPEMNGYDAIRAIRKIRPILPLIAQTAHAMTEDKQKVIDVGANDYITKPINKNELKNKIIKYIK